MSKDEERIIVAKVLNGQTEEYRILVERYQRGLIVYLFNMLGDEMQAEDIAQEAFLQAFHKLDTYNPAYSFSTWLYRIATNMSLRYLAKSKRVVNLENIDIPHDSDSTAEQLDAQKAKVAMRGAVSKLNPNYRQVINLYYWGDKSYEEIALIMGCPIGTVRTWLSRSKQELREELYGQI